MKKGTKVILGVIGVLIIGGAIGANSGKDSKGTNTPEKSVSAVVTTTSQSETDKTPTVKSTTIPSTTAEFKTEAAAPIITEPVTEAPTESSETLSQKNALRSAKNYISMMGFSYTGLIQQLEFEGYPHEDAVYGADNCNADWFAEAAESAQNYINLMPMSKEELINQLEFEGFTSEQAEHGAQAVGY